jgi:hypothetical protein
MPATNESEPSSPVQLGRRGRERELRLDSALELGPRKKA